MTDRYDPSRAKPETVRALCESIESVSPSDTFHWARQLRSECRLRTRAEIATDLVTKIGCSAYGGGPNHTRQLIFNLPDGASVTELLDLLIEFSKSSAPTGADDTPPASPGGGDLLFAFGDYLARANSARCGSGRISFGGPLGWNEAEALRLYVAAHKHASGPPGAAAAKESTDNAAAPEGAALHDVERECNCEQAVELLQRLERFRDELDKTRIESAERWQTLKRVTALVSLWRLQVADYPKTTEGEYGAAGVRCCTRELEEALKP